MRNLLRAAAACALTLTALSTVEAATYRTCVIRCEPTGIVSVSTTWADCCGPEADVSQYCASGSGYAHSWNSFRCIS